MVGVAQLAERWLVEPDVAGSSPVVHPSEMRPGLVPGRFRMRRQLALCKTWAMTQTLERVDVDELTVLDTPWVAIVWNDPVNLMSYVSYIFRSYFGFSRDKAEELMLQVHHNGRAVVATGSREEVERHTEAMHDFGLWATVQRDGA